MSLDTYEVRWADTNGRIHRTRVYPGTGQSSAQYILNNNPNCVEIIEVLKEIPRYEVKTCGCCHQPVKIVKPTLYEKQDINLKLLSKGISK